MELCVFSQLVKGGDVSKTLDMKGREAAVKLVDVSALKISPSCLYLNLIGSRLKTILILICSLLKNFFVWKTIEVSKMKLNFSENEQRLQKPGCYGSKQTQNIYRGHNRIYSSHS